MNDSKTNLRCATCLCSDNHENEDLKGWGGEDYASSSDPSWCTNEIKTNAIPLKISNCWKLLGSFIVLW